MANAVTTEERAALLGVSMGADLAQSLGMAAKVQPTESRFAKINRLMAEAYGVMEDCEEALDDVAIEAMKALDRARTLWDNAGVVEY